MPAAGYIPMNNLAKSVSCFRAFSFFSFRTTVKLVRFLSPRGSALYFHNQLIEDVDFRFVRSIFHKHPQVA